MAWGELFLYAWSCLYRYWLIAGPARLLACGQPCSEKTRPKENTNAPNFAKPLSQPSSPPHSGFVQPCAAANPAIAFWLQSVRLVGRVAELGSLGKRMKIIRQFVFYCLVLTLCCIWSGCATTQSYDQQMRAREEKAAWDQMTPCEKADAYLGVWWWLCGIVASVRQ